METIQPHGNLFLCDNFHTKKFFLTFPTLFSIHILLHQIPEPAHALPEEPRATLVWGVVIIVRAMFLTSPYTLVGTTALT